MDPWKRRGLVALGVLKFVATLYCFLLSITLVGAGFKGLGAGFSEALIASTENPFVGLFIGILATSIVQSSSATTSMIVGMVYVGTLTVRGAVPIIMGANIGTTVTAVLVSLGHIRRKDEFRRAFGAALVHEFFKLFTVAILLPLELTTHFLERTACALYKLLFEHDICEPGAAASGFKGPIKAVLDPVANGIVGMFKAEGVEKIPAAGAILILVVALVLLFGSLWLITKMMRRAIVGRAEALIDRTIGRAPFLGLVAGLVLTAVVQSSSAVTSILVPLAAAGVLTLSQIFLIALGSCLGTTVTALLASLATSPAGVIVALTHVLFNLTGIALIYPVPYVRALPVRLARWFAGLAAESKLYAIGYVVGTFFLVPGGLILLMRAI
jgi:sodium-dependent phosphate cotransporter